MKIRIKREKNGNKDIQEFDVKDNQTLLNALIQIKEDQDNTLAFRCGCKSGVCGSCAVRVNSTERLACKTYIKDNDLIEPLNNSSVCKDLIIDLEYEQKKLKKTATYLHKKSDEKIGMEDQKKIDIQSNCILCQSCYSSCPVFEVNKDFLGPYALTRALRYIDDKKEADKISIIDQIQNNGIWDCTLCGNCTIVCPQFIDPKSDIMNLRMKSVQNGYEDKSLNMFNNDFNSDINSFTGFDPNGF